VTGAGPVAETVGIGRARSSAREVAMLLADVATVWTEVFPAEQARIVQLLVKRVDVLEDALEVRIRAEGLASLVAELRQRDDEMARTA
jgi:site-specific DNA recombinase